MVLRMTDPDPQADPLQAGMAPAEIGAAVIARHLPTLPLGPGVYRMIDARGEVLYVGKARSLRKRVTSYTKTEALSVRIQRMVRLVAMVEITTTHTEAEALLLKPT